MATPGLETNGNWTTSKYEAIDTTSTSNWGLMYRSGAHLNGRVEVLANELKEILNDKTIELDNPTTLAKLSSLNGHYNSARQAQSNLMKSIKDTSQAIIRNM